eukprot:7350179-Prymnesium_polylepis.1
MQSRPQRAWARGAGERGAAGPARAGTPRCAPRRSRGPQYVLEAASKLHTDVTAAGVHWCGWHPGSAAIDVVANRVWPWKICGAEMADGVSRLPYSLSSSVQRSVRLPFTTRRRRPAPSL